MQEKLYDVIREAIHLEWDPIGVGESALELREYDSYVPGFYLFLQSDPSEEEIFTHLWTIETQSIGLQGNRLLTEQFAKRIISLCGSHKI